MISILAKRFIKDYENMKSQHVRHNYGMLCGIMGIFLNLVLFIGKFLAGTFSHSIAITADAINNLSDAGSSFITLAGFKLASQKPDPDHPYGHGRIEYLSGLFVSLLIILMAVELLKTSVNKIIHPTETSISLLVMVILAVSILIKLYMSFYNRNIGKKIDSAALLATAADCRGDMISTLLVLISSGISYFWVFKLTVTADFLSDCSFYIPDSMQQKKPLTRCSEKPLTKNMLKKSKKLSLPMI